MHPLICTTYNSRTLLYALPITVEPSYMHYALLYALPITVEPSLYALPITVEHIYMLPITRYMHYL